MTFLGTFDIFRSTNGGTTYINLTCGYAGGTTVHVDHHALAYLPGSSSVLLAGSDGGAYVTFNANATSPSFSQLNNSLSTLEFYSGDITANFATAAQPGVNGGMQDNGSAVYVWEARQLRRRPSGRLRKGGDGMFARIEPVLGQRWYQESQNGDLAVSTSGPSAHSSRSLAAGRPTAAASSSPIEIQKNGCPPTGCTHMIAGCIVSGSRLPALGSWTGVNSPDLTKNTLADRSFINQLNYAWSDNNAPSSAPTTATCRWASTWARVSPTAQPGSTSPAATRCCPTGRSWTCSRTPPTR